MNGWQWRISLGILLWLTVVPTLPADDASNKPKPSWALTPTELNNLGVTAAQAGRLEEAIDHLRHAVLLAPTDTTFRKNLANMLTEHALQAYGQRHVDQAIELLEEAVTHLPDHGPALARLGDLYYLERSDFDQALRCWEQAQDQVPAEQREAVAERISRARRDRTIERGYASRKTDHFDIRMQGQADPQRARRLGQVLEEEYARIAKNFGTAPPMLTVIVYSRGDFTRIADRRDWALGLYDGRIRVREDELDGVWERILLAHELGHAFLYQAYRRGLPTWVHEGFAQAMEPPRALTPQEQALKEGLTSKVQWIPLAWVDRRFQQPSNPADVERGYVESRMVVEFLLRRYGMERFQAFLARLAGGEAVELAFDATFAPSRWSRVAQGVLE
ncbi:MAG: tetratricopeptide repeat protein [Candidatus Omnitrophica bacterium]|nr:tetratricopeptide repeat protein [Candidatus Omnitrophota bacterium]